MGLRRWVRRGRVRTPPEVMPLVVIAFVATFVAQLAIGFSGTLIAAVVVLVTEPQRLWDVRALPVIPSEVVLGVLVVLGWRLVRRLVAGWFRRQPPDPLRP